MLARSLAAFLCSAIVVAHTASADALLSNLDESIDAGIPVGTPVDSPNVDFIQAIRFQTGSSERGYNLTSVKAVLANAAASDGVRVRIFGARTNGTPYISFYTLTNPVIADGTMTFTAPASATLRKDAGYFVIFDSTFPDAGNDYEIRGTESESLNSQADGWSPAGGNAVQPRSLSDRSVVLLQRETSGHSLNCPLPRSRSTIFQSRSQATVDRVCLDTPWMGQKHSYAYPKERGLNVALHLFGGTRCRPVTPLLLAAACSLLAPGSPVTAADASTGSASRANSVGYEPYVTMGIAAVRSSGARFVDGADAGHAALYGSRNTFDAGAFDAGFTIDVAAGVRLGSALRAQLEFGVAGALNYRGNTNYRNAGAHQPSEAELDLSQAFLIGFYEFPDWEFSSSRTVTPFLGAGAGVTTYRLSGYVQRFPDPENPLGSLRAGPGGEIPFTAVPDGRGRNPSWMLTGGVSIPIREKFQLDLAYRYTDAGTIRTHTGDIAIVRYREEGTRRQFQVPINETTAKLQTHALLMTLRFDL